MEEDKVNQSAKNGPVSGGAVSVLVTGHSALGS
jgi:hypothetical protein